MSGRFVILSDSGIDAIYRSSLQILEHVRALVISPRALKLLEDAGAKVDLAKKLVKVPSDLVEELLRKHPSNFAE